jgi:hypothetical protein
MKIGSNFCFQSLKDAVYEFVQLEEKLLFDCEIPVLGVVNHPNQATCWKLISEEFSAFLEEDYKFLAVRVFLDEFAPYANPKRKIYGIYVTLLNLLEERFNKSRKLLGIVPENGILFNNYGRLGISIHVIGNIQEALSVFMNDLKDLEEGKFLSFCEATGREEKFVGSLFMVAGDYPGIAQAAGTKE